MRRLVAFLAVAAVAIGIAAEAASFSGLDAAVADLAAGWVLLGCGLWGLPRRVDDATWPLLVLAGVAWFAPNLAGAGLHPASPVLGALVLLHRGPLVHAVAAPAARARSRLAFAAIAAGYADAVGIADGLTAPATAVLLVALGSGSAVRRLRGTGRAAPVVPAAAFALAAALAIAGALALIGVTAGAASASTYAYDAAIAATALFLVAAAATAERTLAVVADLVVDVGPGRGSGAVRDALARTLGDPALEIGYWLAPPGVWIGEDGGELVLPAPGSRRRVTVVERDGERLAALVHAPIAIDRLALAGVAEDAALLVLANGRLRAAAAHQVAELDASRRRLVAARDEQRRRLERRLHDGAQRHLRDVAIALRDVRATAGASADPELLDLIDAELSEAQEQLVDLARGIHPRTLSEQGLSAALEGLAHRASVPVALTAPGGSLPAPVEAAAYFVCSEALANVGKYAQAERASCEVERREGRLRVRVTDDGVGGADPARGSGLRGLADRVEALGGTLAVTSPPGGGTTVCAELPLDATAVQGVP